MSENEQLSTEPRPKVLVAEEIAARGIEILRELCDVEVAAGMDEETLLSRVADANALVVRSATQVTDSVLDAGKKLEVVGRAGTGVDNVDLAAATRRGVLVVNAPTSNSVSAAEHAIALLLAEARNIAQGDATLREGEWARKRLGGVELYGKTLGILGLGRIGSLVATRMASFDMRIVAYDPFANVEAARKMGVELVGSVDDVLRRADFLTIHMPRTSETENLIDAGALALMKDGARIVNAARGGIVDEAALAEAVRSGKIAGAGIDVYATEPCTDSPLFDVTEVVVTPHLGASTVEAQDRAGVIVAEQIVAALRGEFVPHGVNIDIGRGLSDDVQRFLPVAEALGRFFSAYAGGVDDRVEVSISGELSQYDPKALVLAVLKGIFTNAVDEPISFVNASQFARDRGLEVREVLSPKAREYKSLIAVSGVVAGREVSVEGTLHGVRREPQIVRVNDYEIDIAPSPYMAMISNDDRPGVIGSVGMALGDAAVNIANMVVGRHVSDPYAMMGLNLDQSVADDVAETVRSTPGIIEAKFLDLR